MKEVERFNVDAGHLVARVLNERRTLPLEVALKELDAITNEFAQDTKSRLEVDFLAQAARQVRIGIILEYGLNEEEVIPLMDEHVSASSDILRMFTIVARFVTACIDCRKGALALPYLDIAERRIQSMTQSELTHGALSFIQNARSKIQSAR